MFRRALIGAVLTVSAVLVGAPAAAAETCTVEDATLTWGFKESFRSYISGTIANGEWTVGDGATYETPDFGWSGGTGSLVDGTGSVAFEGSIRFTGHAGILDTTVANPQLRLEEGEVTLLLDVSGTTQGGLPVDEKSVEFATLEQFTAKQGDDSVVINQASAVLTAAGAAAFGTYAAGDELDPISATLRVSDQCADSLPQGEGARWNSILLLITIAFAVIVGLAVLTAVSVVIVMARRATRRLRASASE